MKQFRSIRGGKKATKWLLSLNLCYFCWTANEESPIQHPEECAVLPIDEQHLAEWFSKFKCVITMTTAIHYLLLHGRLYSLYGIKTFSRQFTQFYCDLNYSCLSNGSLHERALRKMGLCTAHYFKWKTNSPQGYCLCPSYALWTFVHHDMYPQWKRICVCQYAVHAPPEKWDNVYIQSSFSLLFLPPHSLRHTHTEGERGGNSGLFNFLTFRQDWICSAAKSDKRPLKAKSQLMTWPSCSHGRRETGREEREKERQ